MLDFGVRGYGQVPKYGGRAHKFYTFLLLNSTLQYALDGNLASQKYWSICSGTFAWEATKPLKKKKKRRISITACKSLVHQAYLRNGACSIILILLISIASSKLFVACNYQKYFNTENSFLLSQKYCEKGKEQGLYPNYHHRQP